MGWNADVRVDGKAYNLMGKPPNLRNFTNANQTSVQLTPSRTSYLLKAGPVDVNMTFFTPIEVQTAALLAFTEMILIHCTGSKPNTAVNTVLISISNRYSQ